MLYIGRAGARGEDGNGLHIFPPERVSTWRRASEATQRSDAGVCQLPGKAALHDDTSVPNDSDLGTKASRRCFPWRAIWRARRSGARIGWIAGAANKLHGEPGRGTKQDRLRRRLRGCATRSVELLRPQPQASRTPFARPGTGIDGETPLPGFPDVRGRARPREKDSCIKERGCVRVSRQRHLSGQLDKFALAGG